MPGVTLCRRVDGGTEIRIDPSPRRDGGPCRVAVYLNGNAVSFLWLYSGIGGGPDRFNAQRMRVDDLVPIDQLDALELYGPGYRPVAGEPSAESQARLRREAAWK